MGMGEPLDNYENVMAAVKAGCPGPSRRLLFVEFSTVQSYIVRAPRCNSSYKICKMTYNRG